MIGVDRCAEHKNHAFLYSQKKSVNRPLKGEAESGWFALYLSTRMDFNTDIFQIKPFKLTNHVILP